MTRLMHELEVAAASDVVMVASDYDGTLAPIVADPDQAHPDAKALSVLVSLSVLPDTHAAILSGRNVAVLERLTGPPAGVELVGSHGAELGGRLPDVEAQARKDLAEVRVRLARLGDTFPGSHLELKPAGVAFHYRMVTAARQSTAESAARRIGRDYPGLTILNGKRVVEITGSATNKGHALRSLRDRWAADVVVFIGDDITDEDAFAALRPIDVGIKVGAGATRARFRVDDQTQVASVLESLLAFRRDKSRRVT